MIPVPQDHPDQMVPAAGEEIRTVGKHTVGGPDGGFGYDQHSHLVGNIQKEFRERLGMKPDDVHPGVKSHTEIGYRILSVNPFFKDVKDFVRYHHETLNGSGYHHKKEGEFPEEAMIISCADIFDALNTDRPYRKALSKEIIMQEMEKNVDIHYKREMLDALLEFLQEEKQEQTTPSES